MSKQNLSNLVQTIRRMLKRKPEEQDPYARVRAPIRKGPGDRSAAVALKEPNE